MRVLIVATNRERAPMPVIPLGACLIASVAEAAGHEVHFLDLMFERRPKAALARAVARVAPEVIGLSVRNLDSTAWLRSTFYLDDAREYVEIARRGDAPVVVGGACIGVQPGEIAAYLGADACIWGDGERAFVELLDRVAQGLPFADLDGVVTLPEGGGAPRVNRQSIVDIATTPRSRVWRWVDTQKYTARTTSLPIQSRRGCAADCVYCSYKSIEGHSYRLRPIPDVVAELAEMAAHQPGASVEFVDSTFNLPIRYSIELSEAIAEADLGLKLTTSGFNPAAVNARLLAAMDAAGFNQVIITPESASDPVLEKLVKGFDVAALRRCAELRRDASFAVMWVFMLGSPGETEQTLAETFCFLERYVPPTDMVFLQPGLRVYPNTGLRRIAIEEGVLDPDQDLIQPFYYLAGSITPLRYREIIVEQIKKHPNYTTIKDVTHPAYPLLLRLSSRLGWESPLRHAPGGLARMASFGLRRPGSSV